MSVERWRRPGAAAAVAYAEAWRAAQSRVRAVGSRSATTASDPSDSAIWVTSSRSDVTVPSLPAASTNSDAPTGRSVPLCALIAVIVQESSSSTRVTPAPAATIVVAARQAASTSGNESRSRTACSGIP